MTPADAARKEGRMTDEQAAAEKWAKEETEAQLGPKPPLKHPALGDWLNAYFRHEAGYLAGFATGREEAAKVERRYRRELWLNHGHDGLYGDDGEMQCSACGANGHAWDYKNAPLAEVEAAAQAGRETRLAAAIRNQQEEK